MATLSLAGLRMQVADIMTRANAKMAEAVDVLDVEALRKIFLETIADPELQAEARKMNIDIVDLDTLLAVSDFVTLHVAKTPETVGLINAERLAKAKKGIRIEAYIYVEAESQKGIVVGKGGTMIRDIGTQARMVLSDFFKQPVHLDLQVKVRPRWRRDDAMLDRLGL
jgi:hypothetical protein